MCEAVVLGPAVAETEGKAGVQEAEKELGRTVMEESPQEAVSIRDRAEAVTVAEAEGFAGDFHKIRLLEFLHPEFLKIGIGPYIVVALEEIYLDSPVHKGLKGRKDTDITLRNNVLIFIPEVPDVTEHIQRLRFGRQRVKEVRKTALTIGRVCNLETEMDI